MSINYSKQRAERHETELPKNLMFPIKTTNLQMYTNTYLMFSIQTIKHQIYVHMYVYVYIICIYINAWMYL